MRKNLMIAMFLVSVLMISFVSASISGYLVRGTAITDSGYTATLQKVDARSGVVTISVETPSGTTEVVRVREGQTAKVGDAEIRTFDLKQGTLFMRGGGNVDLNVNEEAGESEEETELSCKKYDYDEGILGTFDILFWRVEGTKSVQFFESNSPTSNPISKQLNIGDTFTLPDGTTATIYAIDLTTGPKTIVIIKICGDVSGGSGDTKGHTHLVDYKYVTGDLNLDGQTQSYKEYAGKIDCAVKFGKSYVVLGGGYELSPEISAGYIVEANGPASKTVYLVSLRDYNIQYQNLTGNVFATCARLENAIGTKEPHF